MYGSEKYDMGVKSVKSSDFFQYLNSSTKSDWEVFSVRYTLEVDGLKVIKWVLHMKTKI